MDCARYFCIPINSLELCSGIQLSYLETDLSFQVLLLRFIQQDWSSYHSRANFSLLKQDLNVYPMVHKSGGFPVWRVEEAPFLALCEHLALLPLILTDGSFPGPGWLLHLHEFPITHYSHQMLHHRQGDFLLVSRFSLCSALFLVLCPMSPSCLDLPELPAPPSQLKGPTRLFLKSLLSSGKTPYGSPHLFFLSQG